MLNLKDWQGAAEAYRNVLMVYPDYADGYSTVITIYHEKLFLFQQALMLNQQWLERHPDNLSAQANSAETHFTNGRFVDAETRIAALLKNHKLEPGAELALRTLSIATLLALNKPTVVSFELAALHALVKSWPDNLEFSWSFEGSKHFISNELKFAAERTWLLELITAVEEKKPQKRLVALEKIQIDFKNRAR